MTGWAARHEAHVILASTAVAQFALISRGQFAAQLAVCAGTAVFLLGYWRGRDQGFSEGVDQATRWETEAYLDSINETLTQRPFDGDPEAEEICRDLEFEGIRARVLLDRLRTR